MEQRAPSRSPAVSNSGFSDFGTPSESFPRGPPFRNQPKVIRVDADIEGEKPSINCSLQWSGIFSIILMITFCIVGGLLILKANEAYENKKEVNVLKLELDKTRKSSDDEKKELEKIMEQLEAEVSGRGNDLRCCERKNTILEQENEKLKTENEELRQENEKLKTENEELKEKPSVEATDTFEAGEPHEASELHHSRTLVRSDGTLQSGASWTDDSDKKHEEQMKLFRGLRDTLLSQASTHIPPSGNATPFSPESAFRRSFQEPSSSPENSPSQESFGHPVYFSTQESSPSPPIICPTPHRHPFYVILSLQVPTDASSDHAS